ncbi:hypothetical protein HK405_011753, partial [Cladochytrium tenue]
LRRARNNAVAIESGKHPVPPPAPKRILPAQGKATGAGSTQASADVVLVKALDLVVVRESMRPKQNPPRMESALVSAPPR